jgi:5,10-methylene-tetrahydrofolate dehydrogenase/methenyl tetrahydrofolate cyclohydrolase
MLIDGNTLAGGILESLKQRIESQNLKPLLVDVVLEDDILQLQYARVKKRAAEQIGVHCQLKMLPKSTTTEAVREELQGLNVLGLSGLMLQLPLPYYINLDQVLNVINPSVDVDCLTTFCRTEFYNNKPIYTPPTAKAILYILDSLNIDLKSKKFFVIGQGELVGKPVAHVLKNIGYQVETGFMDTQDLLAKVKEADVVISGAGSPGLIKGENIKDGAIVIDAGTSEVGGKIEGDVETSSVLPKAGYLSATPGGVGPLTVAMLLENVVEAAENFSHK